MRKECKIRSSFIHIQHINVYVYSMYTQNCNEFMGHRHRCTLRMCVNGQLCRKRQKKCWIWDEWGNDVDVHGCVWDIMVGVG